MKNFFIMLVKIFGLLTGLADEYFVVFYDLQGRRNACRASPEGSIFPRIFLPGELAFHAHS